MQNFISLLMVLIFFENFEFFSGKIYHLSKMSLHGTIGSVEVTGYARSSVPEELSFAKDVN